MKNKNRHFNTFIDKVTPKDKNEPKICISRFPSEILFDLIHYVRNHWEGGYKGVLFVKEGIRLHRRVFTNSIDTQNCVFEEQVEFYNCIFESLEIKLVSFQKGITFEKCKFKEQTEFYNCIFESLKIKQISLQEGITFEKCKFEEQTEFYNCIFESLKIKQVFFQKSITFEGCKLGIRPPDDKGILGEKLPIAVFEGVIFQSDIKYFITHCDNLYFKKCKFEGDININDTEIDNQVVFLDCDFYKDCDFKDIEFKGETSFKGCKFDNRYSKIDFSGCTFNTADFSNTEFIGDLDFSLREEVNGDVKGVVFKNYVDFKNSKIKNAGFKGVIFQNNVYFEEAVLENIDFSGAKFVDPERDKDTINKFQRKEINFSRVKFGTVSFENTLFEKNVRFHESTFEKEADFYNTSFKKLADFYLVNFQAEQQFHLTDFLDRAIFSNVIFHKEVQFIYNKTDKNSYINFESAIFKRGLDISRSNFNCNLNFWNLTIEEKGIEEIFDHLSNDATSKELKYIDDFGEHKERAIPSVYKQIRESFRIIKNSFYAQNNRIEGLNFNKRELETYERSIGKDKKNKERAVSNDLKKNIQIGLKKMVKNTYRNPILPLIYLVVTIYIVLVCYEMFFVRVPSQSQELISILYKYPEIYRIIFLVYTFFFYLYYGHDKVMLFVNRISNCFGTSWIQGVFFTIAVIYLTYITLRYSVLGVEGFSSITMMYMCVYAFLYSFNYSKIARILGILISVIGMVLSCYVANKYLSIDFTIKGINNFIEDSIKIQAFTKWDNVEIGGYKIEGVLLLILFIGRIFIGYGYYQTIQAFRKFGKS